MDTKEPLPNAFGGADIFGRKRTTGKIEVRYMGMLSPGHPVFRRRDVSILTNETTMNRAQHYSGFTEQSGSSGMVYGSVSSAAHVEALPADTVEIVVDMAADPSLMVEGAEIRILEATPTKVVVQIVQPSR